MVFYLGCLRIMECVLVNNSNLINTVYGLAQEIYREHYSKIVPMDFLEYWIELYQNKQTIIESINSGEIYYLIKSENEYVGYFSYTIDNLEKNLFISKLYIRKDSRGKGLARFAFEKILNTAKSFRLNEIWLKTLRKNPSVKIYQKFGFEIFKEVKTDIGQGFILDDYILKLNLSE